MEGVGACARISHVSPRIREREVHLERETSCRFSVVRDSVRGAWRGDNCARTQLASRSRQQIGDRSHATRAFQSRESQDFMGLAMMEPND